MRISDSGIVLVGEHREWRVAGEGGVVKFKSDRKVYVYLPQIKGGKSRVRLNGVRMRCWRKAMVRLSVG